MRRQDWGTLVLAAVVVAILTAIAAWRLPDDAPTPPEPATTSTQEGTS